MSIGFVNWLVRGWGLTALRLGLLAGGCLLAMRPALAALSIDDNAKAGKRQGGYEVPKSTSGITYCGGDSFYVVADDGNDTTYELGLHAFTFQFRDDDGSYTMFHRKPSTASEVRAGHVTLEKTFDLEACAYDPGSGNVWAANEAGSGSAAANTIREYNPKTGKIVSELTVPNVIRQNARGNFGLEALTVSGDGLTLWTCNEEALTCDGNRSSASESTTVRLVKFTRATTSDAFQLAAMYGYTVPKWEHSSGGMASSSQRNGVSGLCALPDGTLLVLERELSNDYFVNRICIADVRSATNVKDFAALKETTWTGAARTVLKRFWSGGGDVNLLSRTAYNYEGICLGPREPNGNHLLMLIADAGDGYTSPFVRAEHLHGLDSRTLAFGRPPVGTATCVGQNFRLDATKPFTMTVTGLGAAKLRWRLPKHTPSSGIVTAANPSFSFTPSADDTLTWEVAGEEEEPEAHEHDWGAGSVTTQPTCGDSGVRTYTCACGETKTEPIAATGNHTFVNGVCTTCRTPDPNYVPPSTATTYYLVGSDAAGASSFAKSSSSSVGWATRQNGSVIPTHTVSINYDYVIPDGNVMRLPTTTGALTFAGKSLTIVRNGGILLKGTHDTVSFAQLTCDGGAITAGDANKSTRISGPMTILDGTTLGFTVLRPDSTSDTTVTIDELKGTGTLRLKASADTAASKTQTLVLTEAGDFQGTVNAASCSTDKKFVLQVKGGFGGAIASLPKGTSKVVFDYQRLDRDFGVRVAALDAGDVAVTAPPEGFTSGLVFTDVPDPTADDLPLVTFPATVTVDPTAFTVKYAAGASGTATAFSNLAAIRHGDGTTTLVANHVTAPPPTTAKGFARAKAENRPARVLVIGNSFTQGISRAPRKDGAKLVETRTHFPTAVRAMGERIDYCALYRGGSTIQQHYENRATKGFFAEINWSFDSGAPSWANGAKDGQFVCDEDSTTCDNSESPTAPSATTPFHISLDDLLAAVDWDVIVIQESSSIAQFPAGTPESLWTGVNAANEARRDYGRGTPRYAFGNIYEYVAYLKGARPGAELWIHQTWAHEKDSRQVELGTMAKCDAMYNAVNASVASVAVSYGLKVIPTGYAVQRYRHELPVTAKTQDPCGFDSRHINGGDYLYGESRIPADQLYRTYLQIMTWCQRFYGGMPPAGLAGVANVVAKTDSQRGNASYVELNGAPWFEPSNADEKTVMRACAAAAGALETYPDMEIAEEPDPSVQATYYFVGGDAAGKSSFAGSTAGAASGWATSVGGAVVTHTVAAGNAYVVPNALGLRAAESPQSQTFKGDRLILRTGNLFSKKSVNLSIPELAVENAGTIYFGAGNLTIKILDGDITVPEDATLHLKMLFDTTTSASALELRSRLVGAGLIRICDATNDQAPSGTQTLLIAEADEYTGSIYAKDEPYAQRFVLKVTGGFGGTIESLPNGTEKVVFNLAGLDPSVGVRVSDDASGVPAGFASGLVFFGVTNPSAADLPLVTFPAGMAIDPTAFTVGYATGADAAATPFATLGAVTNADGTTTLVANPTATPVDPPDDPPVTEYVRTVSANTSEENLVFEGTTGRLALDGATLTVSGTVAQYVAYRFGEDVTGALTLDVSGANAGLVHSTASSAGYIGSTTATSDMLVRFTVPATPWTVAPIRATAGDSKVRFQQNVRFAVDATAVANPGAGETIRVPLASATDGVRFDGVDFAAVKQRSAVECADGVTGELGLEDNLLYLTLSGSGGSDPEPPVTKPVYYLVGEDKSGNAKQWTSSSAGATTGWAASAGGAVITHTVSAGNEYVVGNQGVLRTSTKVTAQTFAGDKLTLANANIFSPKTIALSIPELAVDGAGTLYFGGADITVTVKGGKVTIPDGSTLHAKMLFGSTVTSAGLLDIRSQLVGAGLIRICDVDDATPTGTQTLTLADAADFTGRIYSKPYTDPQRFILKVTGGFGGEIVSLPCGTEKVVFNAGGIDETKGVVVAATDESGNAVTAVPNGLAMGLVLFNVADVTAADLPLVTFPATVAVDPTAFTVSYASSADGAATPFENLGVVENDDGTKTLVANCAKAMTAAEIGGTSYDTVAEACAEAKPGDTVKLVRAPTAEDRVAFKPGVTVDLNGLELADGAYTTPGEWFDVRTADGQATIELNEKARPTIEGSAGESDTAFAVGEESVTVAVGNVKPNLYYGLAAAATLEGLETDEPTAWMQADGEGKLEPLTADKTAGAKTEFFRVVVRDLPEL